MQNRLKLLKHSNVLFILLFCLAQLVGCSFLGRQRPSADGPPKIDIDPSKIKDAVPRSEPYHKYGTRDYVVGGRRYKVLKSTKGYVKKGYASWYGAKFHGNHTSTQERYNLYEMTAASRELPIPSYVQVTNLRNGKQAVVRVNDRGPFHSKRILDLSYAAAKRLDFVGHGTTLVKVVAIDPKTWHQTAGRFAAEPLHPEPRAQESQASQPHRGLYLQVGAFAQQKNAKTISKRVSQLTGRPTKAIHKNNLYLVTLGPLKNVAQCEQIQSFLEEHGFANIIHFKQP